VLLAVRSDVNRAHALVLIVEMRTPLAADRCRISNLLFALADIDTSQIDPRTSLFVLVVIVGNFSVVLAY
jgi:hypothetical protein